MNAQKRKRFSHYTIINTYYFEWSPIYEKKQYCQIKHNKYIDLTNDSSEHDSFYI